MRLSTLGSEMQGQPMFEILELAQELERQGKKIIHFELGEPNFETPEHISLAAIRAIADGDTHYAPSSGIYDLKVAVQEATKSSRGFEPTHRQILVAPGANAIIYLAVKCLANPGDEVLIQDPGFPTYWSAIRACGAKPVSVPINEESGFELLFDEVERRITNKTKLLILNSPSNPTGGVTSPTEIRKIAEMCSERGVFILSDEIYARLIFSEKRFFSPSQLDACREYTIVLNGFSKAFAMTGWRLGIAIGPADVIEKMGLLVSTIVSCVPPFVQRAGIAALTGDQTMVLKMKEDYRARMELLVEGLNGVKGINARLSEGAIYVFANIRDTGYNSFDFSKTLLTECGIATTPGTCFGDFGEGYVRFSVVTSRDDILLAIARLREFFGAV